MFNVRTSLIGVAAVVTLIGATACTDGAPGSGAANGAGVTTIDVSLTSFAAISTAEGRAGGYSPAQISVPVGTRLRFTNVDSFAHTASAVARAKTFPDGSPLTARALAPSADGTPLSRVDWSSGNLAAGASSPMFVADTPGTFLFGCFYHYAAPMRGVIHVR